MMTIIEEVLYEISLTLVHDPLLCSPHGGLAIDAEVAYESGLENDLDGKGLEVTAEERTSSWQSALREATGTMKIQFPYH